MVTVYCRASIWIHVEVNTILWIKRHYQIGCFWGRLLSVPQARGNTPVGNASLWMALPASLIIGSGQPGLQQLGNTDRMERKEVGQVSLSVTAQTTSSQTHSETGFPKGPVITYGQAEWPGLLPFQTPELSNYLKLSLLIWRRKRLKVQHNETYV